MKCKIKSLLFLIIALPIVTDAQDSDRFGYSGMTSSAKESVDEFIQDYGEAVKRRLAPLGEENAGLISERLMETMRQEYMLEYEQANETEMEIFSKYPDSTLLLARMAAIHYSRGITRHGDVNENFKQTVEYSEKCLDIEPENGECWFFYGAGLGEYISSVGIFQTLSHIKEVHDAFEKAVLFTAEDPFPFGPLGMTSRSAAYIGITQFYRMCPDWWIMKVIAGVRGDKKKAYEYSKEINPVDFDRASFRARAALCYGATEKNMEIVEEGIAIVREAANFDIVNPLHAYVRRQILELNRIFTDNKNLGMNDYHKIGCHNIQKPDNL